MNATDRAYERLVAANPMPDPERYLDVAGHDEWQHVSSLDEAIVIRPIEARRWLVVAAMFAAVILAGGAALIGLRGTGDVATSAPIDVVAEFFERWNRGDVAGALALVDPEASIPGAAGVSDFRGLMEWSLPFDGVMDTECSPAGTPGSVNCEWVWRIAATDALGLDASSGRFVVEDGRIVRIETPSYGLVELRLGSFASQEDPAGFADACAPDQSSPMSTAGFPFTERCGRFLAEHEAAFVASLTE